MQPARPHTEVDDSRLPGFDCELLLLQPERECFVGIARVERQQLRSVAFVDDGDAMPAPGEPSRIVVV